MSPIRASSSNAIQVALCQGVMSAGMEVDPRGMKTRELLGVSFELTNPRCRLTTIPERNWSSALAVAEFLWHLRGDTSVAPLAFYTPRWRSFADPDGEVRGSCYGARIFGAMDGHRAQWGAVKSLLQKDINSRRAVLNLRNETDVSKETKDMSCTNSLQFIVRQGKLCAFANMRSNDVIWGVPYDLFLFTCLQELMAIELGLELGSYYHYSASMHVYERHYQLADLIKSSGCGQRDDGMMPRMSGIAEVCGLAEQEAAMREHGKRYTGSNIGFAGMCAKFLSEHRKLAAIAA